MFNENVFPGLKHTNDTPISSEISHMTPNTWFNTLISIHTCSHNPQVIPSSYVEASQVSTSPSTASPGHITTQVPISTSTNLPLPLPTTYVPAQPLHLPIAYVPAQPTIPLPNSPNSSPISLAIKDTLPQIPTPSVDPISTPPTSLLLNSSHTPTNFTTKTSLPPVTHPM